MADLGRGEGLCSLGTKLRCGLDHDEVLVATSQAHAAAIATTHISNVAATTGPYMHTHDYVHTCMHAYIHTYIHTYTYVLHMHVMYLLFVGE